MGADGITLVSIEILFVGHHVLYNLMIHIGSEPDPPPQSFNLPPSSIRRMVLAETLDEVLSSNGDSLIPIIVPMMVAEKCNQLILDALKEHDLPASAPSLIPALKPGTQQVIENRSAEGEDLVPMFWHIDAIRAWQQIDRRIDE